jgi:hypothetical protein
MGCPACDNVFSDRNHRNATVMGASMDARAPAVLDVLASLESQLGTLTINTVNMN